MNKLLYVSDRSSAQRFSNLHKQGKVRRLHRGIYTENLTTPLSNIAERHWMEIVSKVVPEGIISYITAVELKPIPYQSSKKIVFVTSSYWKTIEIEDLIIVVNKGNSIIHKDQVTPFLAKSSFSRTLLENLTPIRKKQFVGIKTIGIEKVEKILAKEMRRGEDNLKRIAKEAKKIAHDLGMEYEFSKLDTIINALITGSTSSDLQSSYAKAIARRQPFDGNRIILFENLSLYLQKCVFIDRPYHYQKSSFKNLAFFESYFSNFIEGTEFLIDEAEEIVFKGKEIQGRHADSHDVLSHFYISDDYTEMSITPATPSDFLNLLKSRHAQLLNERPEKNPGAFKSKPNKAGNTYFVDPQDVIGTLTQGFDIYKILQEGIQRALFMHFLISEVHPFSDGNGRLARIMMNAELVKSGSFKIIIPTVHRDNYLNGLRRASRDNYFHTYCKTLDQAQAYTASIDWRDYGAAREKIEEDNADSIPDEGLPIFNRQLRKLVLSDLD